MTAAFGQQTLLGNHRQRSSEMSASAESSLTADWRDKFNLLRMFARVQGVPDWELEEVYKLYPLAGKNTRTDTHQDAFERLRIVVRLWAGEKLDTFLDCLKITPTAHKESSDAPQPTPTQALPPAPVEASTGHAPIDADAPKRLEGALARVVEPPVTYFTPLQSRPIMVSKGIYDYLTLSAEAIDSEKLRAMRFSLMENFMQREGLPANEAYERAYAETFIGHDFGTQAKLTAGKAKKVAASKLVIDQPEQPPQQLALITLEIQLTPEDEAFMRRLRGVHGYCLTQFAAKGTDQIIAKLVKAGYLYPDTKYASHYPVTQKMRDWWVMWAKDGAA